MKTSVEDHRRILLVEDECVIADTIASWLRALGYEVERAKDAPSALEAADRAELVLMDIDLGPGPDGSEVARDILARREMPLIFLSSHTEREFVERAAAVASYGYVLKESGPAVIGESVRVAFRLFEARERARIEEEERRKEQVFNDAIFENFPGIFYVYDESGTLLRWNRRQRALTGYDDEELAGRRLGDWFTGEDEPEVRRLVARVLAEGSGEMEAHLRVKGGGSLFIHVNCVRVTVGGRNYVFGIAIDISEKERYEARLRASEEKHRFLVENSYDVIYTMDTDGVFTYVSPAWKQLLGYDPGFAIGKSFADFVHPDFVPICREQLARGAVEGKPIVGIEYRIRHADGSWRWHSSSALPIKDAGGRITGIEGIGRDIEERKRAEMEVERLLAEKDLVLKEVHHRVKNNLATVLSLLNVQASMRGDGEIRDVLLDAAGRVRCMSVLYDRLYRSENARALSVRAFLPPLVDEIASTFGFGDRVRVAVDTGDFTLGERLLSPLGIIVNELVTNSMKYAFAGRESGEIRVTARERDGHVTIEYSDDGPGSPIDPDPARGGANESANGFGMSLVRMLVEQIEGSMEVDPGAGFRYRIEFDTV